MKSRGLPGIALLLLGLGTPLVAQAPGGGEHLAAVKESLQKSIAELHKYQWVQTTVISIKGEEKSRTQESCYYGEDGSLQKTPLGAPESESKHPRGLRGKIAEHKKQEISDSAKQAVALVKQYVPTDPSRIQAAKEAGNLSIVPPDAEGGVKVVVKNYLKTGDSLTIDFNSMVNHVTAVAVSTYAGESKDAVDMTVSFGVFTNDTVYPETIHLDVKSESLAIEVTNSGYRPL